MPSSSWTAVTVKDCATFQLSAVNSRLAGATRTSVPAGASAKTVTAPVGSEARRTV